MIRNLFIISFCFFSISLFAQYTEVINSNRPGFSESPYGVGNNVYQFESTIFHRNVAATPTFSNPKATGINLQFRTSFINENLEFNLTTALQNDTFAFTNIYQSQYTETGLSELTIAAKYLVYKPNYKKKKREIRSWKKRHAFNWKRWIPHVAVYGGIHFGSILADYHQRGGISPKFGVLFQNEFSNKLNMITNIYYDYIGSDLPQWTYIITGTYNFSDKWSGFAEHQANYNGLESTGNIGLGAAYLLNENLQINSSIRATFQDDAVGSYASVGVSYRIDNHIDVYVELDEYGNKVDPLEKKTYNKGFFGRMLDKITGLFKKKDKPNPKVDLDISKPQPEDGVQEGRGRTRQKSILGDLTKQDKKQKKEATKAEKKAAKKKLKTEEKAAKKLEKEKLKEEKRKKKEKEKLEREIQKLEDDIKKEEEKARKEEEKAKKEELDQKLKDEKKESDKEKNN